MILYDNDAYREEFMGIVYGILSSDITNDRANQIIDAFGSAPQVEIDERISTDPLTLEELREMGGEPVWLKVDGANGYYVMFCGFDCDCKAAHFWNDFPRYLKNYGENWLAYRRKPEGQTR